MSEFNLASLTDKDPYVQKLKAALGKAIGQKIPLVNILKAQRVAGASVRGVQMELTGGQSITFLLRQDGDVFRVQINGKDYAMTGDLSASYEPSFKAGVSEIAGVIAGGQKAFEKKQAKQKIIVPQAKGNRASTPKNTVQQLKQLAQAESDIDQVIVQKTEQRDLLKKQVEQKAIQAPQAPTEGD